MTARRIVNPKMVTPPGGSWTFSVDGDTVSSPLYDDMLRKVDALLRKHGVNESAVAALANYMCPLLPEGQCTGEGSASPVIYPHDAEAEAKRYFGRPIETADVIARRLQQCTRCKAHRRDFCLHCTGYDQWVYGKFGGKRPKLPADDASGCCSCAKTMEAVIASVCYGKDEPVWEGAPDTCWRRST